MMDNLKIYYLSNEGTNRDKRMQQRFSELNINVERIEWVSKDWLNEKGYNNYSCTFGHLKMLKKFIESNIEYGCFFEDDVYIKKTFKEDIKILIPKIIKNNLDILLIGYLINYYPYTKNNNHKIIDNNYIILEYPDDLWGAQGYILTKKHALYLVNKYDEKYLDRILKGEKLTPFSPDWNITKDGTRAMIFPMLAVEEGAIFTTHQGQLNFHKSCVDFNYKKDEYI